MNSRPAALAVQTLIAATLLASCGAHGNPRPTLVGAAMGGVGASRVQSDPTNADGVILRSCHSLPTADTETNVCGPLDMLPDGTEVMMRCWENTWAPTIEDPSYTSPKWFYVTEVDHRPGWSGWVYSAEIPVPEQVSTPACSSSILAMYPLGSPKPEPVVPLSFAVMGSCTTVGGALSATSSGFTPGGAYSVAAAYPDGSPYHVQSDGIVGGDGSVKWDWPCAGDPPGEYKTWITDLATGRATDAVAFTIGQSPPPPQSAPPPSKAAAEPASAQPASPSAASPPSPPRPASTQTSPVRTAPVQTAPPTKTLTVDASHYFGNCTSPNNPRYCGADAHSQSSRNFNENAEGPDWPGGTQTTALCWTTGGNVNAPASGVNSDVWINTKLSSSYPWMSELYFQPGATSGLDRC